MKKLFENPQNFLLTLRKDQRNLYNTQDIRIYIYVANRRPNIYIYVACRRPNIYICWLKEVRSKISILLETTGGILFSMEGFKKRPFTIKTFAGWFTFHWRDSDVLPGGFIIPLERFSYPSRGFIIPLEVFS